jgi:hypothetical protein
LPLIAVDTTQNANELPWIFDVLPPEGGRRDFTDSSPLGYDLQPRLLSVKVEQLKAAAKESILATVPRDREGHVV